MSTIETCAWCPRLCRHVCPVAVATGLESATPTAMATAAWMADHGLMDVEVALGAVDLCNGCGACEQHCKLHAPLPALLRAWRERHRRTVAAPLAAIVGDGEVVDLLVGDEPPGDAAWLRTPDALGHAAWKAGDDEVIARVAEHLRGRHARVRHGDIAEVLVAAGIPMTRVPAPPAARTFATCWEGASAGPGQLSCCGRREGFVERQPAAARAMAEENVRLMAGELHRCDDAACASWLRAHGGTTLGPDDAEDQAPVR